MVKNRRTNVKHLPRSHDESWLQRSLPKRWLTASLAVDPSDPLMIMTMTMTKLMRQGRHYCSSPSLSLSLWDLQCKTTEMPRLKSLTKEINLGKLSSFCSSPVSGELHAPINVTLATKNYAQFRSVSRSDPIQKCLEQHFFQLFFSLSSITDFLLSAILLALFFFCAVPVKLSQWRNIFGQWFLWPWHI